MYRRPMNKKDRIVLLILLGALFLLPSIFMTYQSLKDGIAYLMPTVDIYDENYDLEALKETDVIESDINLLMGKYYGYHYTGNASDHYFYVLPVIREDNTIYYMGLKAPKGRITDCKNLSEDALAYITGQSDIPPETISVKGRITKMNEDNERMFRQWFEEAGYEEEGTLLCYYIGNEPTVSDTITMFVMMLASIGSAVMLVCGIFCMKKYRKQVKEQTHIIINGNSYPKEWFARANAFWENGENTFAMQEISRIAQINMAEAEKIVYKWYKYYL